MTIYIKPFCNFSRSYMTCVLKTIKKEINGKRDQLSNLMSVQNTKTIFTYKRRIKDKNSLSIV